MSGKAEDSREFINTPSTMRFRSFPDLIERLIRSKGTYQGILDLDQLLGCPAIVVFMLLANDLRGRPPNPAPFLFI